MKLVPNITGANSQSPLAHVSEGRRVSEMENGREKGGMKGSGNMFPRNSEALEVA